MFVIAGATGKTGGVVARTLLAQGKKVRVLLRDRARTGEWTSRGAEAAVAPLEDAEALERALQGCSGFYALLPEEVGIADFHGRRRAIVAALLGLALGKSLRVVDVPAAAHVGMLMQVGLPEAYARAAAEVVACLASGRAKPQGARLLAGATRLEELLPDLLR